MQDVNGCCIWYKWTRLINGFMCVAFFLGFSAAVNASQLIYTPVNPSFGGNPLNGTVLLNNAQAQNDYKDPELENDDTPIEEFNERLQRSVLNRLTNSIASNFVDAQGNLIPGQTETEDFIITVIDEGNGLVTVTTTDRTTGDSTQFTVQSSSF